MRKGKKSGLLSVLGTGAIIGSLALGGESSKIYNENVFFNLESSDNHSLESEGSSEPKVLCSEYKRERVLYSL